MAEHRITVISEDTAGSDFFSDEKCAVADELRDDQAVYFDAGEGTVVILGCAHAGVINTLRYIHRLTGGRPLHMVLGGMHLVNAGPERMQATVAELREFDIPRLMACHCTGPNALALFHREFPGKQQACQAGTTVAVRA